MGSNAITSVGNVDGVDVSAHAGATSGVHGASGNVVGTTDEQILTNKSLTTPTIGDFSNAGHGHADSGGGGTLDHGDLLGTGDDDHQQYLLVNGTRAMTGSLDMNNHSVDMSGGSLDMSGGQIIDAFLIVGGPSVPYHK